jgi:sugar/nucleoside kinase (ribokinase family)
MPKPLQAVVAGHICLDILPDLENLSGRNLQSLFKPGSLVQIGPARLMSGGPVSNTGLALHKLGVPVRLRARIGADPLGRMLREIIAARGRTLAAGLRIDPAASTSYSIIIGNRETDRLFLHDPGANASFGPEDVGSAAVRAAALLHFGYPPELRRMYSAEGRELAEIMRSAKAAGATTSLDMSLPDPNAGGGRVDWRPIYAAVLPHVDVFLPSFDELLFTLRRGEFDRLSGGGDPTEQAAPALLADLGAELISFGVRVVLIKLGSRGAYLRTAPAAALGKMGRARPLRPDDWADRERWIPCFRVNVVGTTGSGDSTIAGFLAALLRRADLTEALTMAVAVGACNVEAADSLSGLQTWDATRARIKAGWEQAPLSVAESGWSWDSGRRMWIGPRESAGGRSPSVPSV